MQLAKNAQTSVWMTLTARSAVCIGPFSVWQHESGSATLFLITQQISSLVPNLQAVLVDYVMIWSQGFGGFERRFEGLKRLDGMAAVSRDAKRSV